MAVAEDYRLTRTCGDESGDAVSRLLNTGLLDLDPALVQAAKGGVNLSDVLDNRACFCGTLLELFGEVWIDGVQEFMIGHFILVLDEHAYLLQAFLRPPLEKGDDFSFRIHEFLH